MDKWLGQKEFDHIISRLEDCLNKKCALDLSSIDAASVLGIIHKAAPQLGTPHFSVAPDHHCLLSSNLQCQQQQRRCRWSDCDYIDEEKWRPFAGLSFFSAAKDSSQQ